VNRQLAFSALTLAACLAVLAVAVWRTDFAKPPESRRYQGCMSIHDSAHCREAKNHCGLPYTAVDGRVFQTPAEYCRHEANRD
jgi:hypothetical protein